MFRSWTPLRIEKNESNLRSKWRAIRLWLSSGAMWAIFAFVFCGFIISVLVLEFGGDLLVPWVMENPTSLEGFWTAVGILLLFGLPCMIAMFFLLRWAVLHPYILFCMRPEELDILPGTALHATYRPNDEGKSSLNQHLVKFGYTFEGQTHHFYEEFQARIWHFTDAESEAQLRPGDDWYPLKGRRLRLPFPVYVLKKKKNKSACLFGVPAELVERLKKIS